jgi:predicted MFS family arabinose efflux permease
MYTHPNHLRAFTLVVSLMFGTFLVVPFISPYLVANAGVRESDLPWIYVGGGALSLVTSPMVGRWADRSGKLHVYRWIAPCSALVMVILTNLPRAGLVIAVGLVSLLMVCNAGRMVAAMAMVTGSVEPRLRGGFMSAYSSVQHISCGIGSFVAGLILVEGPDGSLRRYWVVGLIGAALTLMSVWLASRLRPAYALPKPRVSDPMADIALDPVPAAEAF